MNNNLKYTLYHVLIVALGTLLLSAVHIDNGFPLLLTDSLGYIRRASALAESSHWSNTYVAFVAFFIHIFKSIQLPIIFQNLMTVLTLYIFSKKFIKKTNGLHFLVIIAALCCTSLIWTSTMLMSDIFTPISLLSIIILLFGSLSKLELTVVTLISFISFSAHQSHILIVPLFTMILLIIYLLVRKHISWKSSKRKLLYLIALFLCSLVFEKNIMNIFQKETAFEKIEQKNDVDIAEPNKEDIYSGYYFIAVRISQSGMLNEILDDFCLDSRKNYLCERDTMYSPIYVKSTSIINRNSENEDYLRFARDNKDLAIYSLRKPIFYYGMFKILIFKGLDLLNNRNIRNYKRIVHSEKQLRRFNNLLKKISPATSVNFMNSNQRIQKYSTVNNSLIRKFNLFWWKFICPTLFLLYIFTFNKYNTLSKDVLIIIIFLILAHIINSSVCATFSNSGNVRYSARTFWLVNFAMCIILHQFIFVLKKIIQPTSNETNRTDTMS